MRRGHGRMPEGYTQLMEISYNVAGRVKTVHGRALTIVNDEITNVSA
jgi:hypothetical protein